MWFSSKLLCPACGSCQASARTLRTGALQLQGRQDLKGNHVQFRIFWVPSFLETGDSLCWMLWTEGLQDGGSPLLLEVSSFYPSLFFLFDSILAILCYYISLLDSILDSIVCAILFHLNLWLYSVLFLSIPFYSIPKSCTEFCLMQRILQNVTKKAHMCVCVGCIHTGLCFE